VKKPTRSKFAVLLEDNQSDQSEGNDERPQSSPDKPTQSKKRNKKKNKKMADQIDDEDALLEKAINEVRLAKHEDRNEEESKSTCVLKVDRNQLDPEAELRNLLEKNMDKSGSRKIAKQTRNARTIGRVIKLKSGWPIVKNTGLISQCL
jgi:hypothetical protein